jgi:hypothetical protein
MRDVKLLVDFLVYGIVNGNADVSIEGAINTSEVIADEPLPNAEAIYEKLYNRATIFFDNYTSSLKEDLDAIGEHIVSEKAKYEKHKEFQQLLNKLI